MLSAENHTMCLLMAGKMRRVFKQGDPVSKLLTAWTQSE